MSFTLPFDPTCITRELEEKTRARHGATEWGSPESRPIRHSDYHLDPTLNGYPPVGTYANRFESTYEDKSIYVTQMDDGVLFGQGFLLCSASHPTVSEERQYQLTHNGLGKLLPELKRRTVEHGPIYLLCANGAWSNFYHWMFECLPSLALLRDVAQKSGRAFRFVLPPLDKQQQRTLELMGVTEEECITLGNREYLYDVPILYTNALHGQFSCQPSPRLIELLAPLRRSAVNDNTLSMPTRFYVSRRDADARKLVNEGSLIAVLQTEGYQELVLSTLSIEEQINAFSGATDIVAPHGAGLVHLMFAQLGCRVLEILPDYHRFAFFFRLAQLRKLRYSMVLSHRPDQQHRANDNGAGQVNIEKVLKNLNMPA